MNLPKLEQPTSAIVFAYHEVGVRCLAVLLAHGVDVKMVITHEDIPTEKIWFGSVADSARQHGIFVAAPDNPHDGETLQRIRDIQPDFIFSFYYRKILKSSILDTAKKGCYNMHGSLLPKYRGRVPVNWAIVNGESETGATLHQMVPKVDAGPIVDQMAVPILPNDTAQEVFNKVLVAAEIVLYRSLPSLVNGMAEHKAMDMTKASYFGGRNRDDGRIDWSQPAQQIHNLVRAVTHPYPGAFTETKLGLLAFWHTMLRPETSSGPPAMFTQDGTLLARAGDGRILEILSVDLDGQSIKTVSEPLDLV
ncbi:hypothetical protein BP6252_11395 [Coleophoma cylindrospora]|uniref:Formyltransferase n=1 Tax=Coleophoma cylindrospora TaxID=1849047 RepID=A0A3D8QJG7_9HELO|nr:hypothetical protein BP6252_11395 [Coleophoma cylindrospora]